MTPKLRKFVLTTHLTSSLGWLGAALTFVGLAAIGLTSQDERTIRGAYLVMAPAGWFVLVPLSHASLVTGLVLSLGTTWGLFRHYWVFLKFLITAFSTVILMIYMGTFRQMAGVAADSDVALAAVRNASPMIHAVLASVLLMVATVLAVYKPLGLTPYGLRKQFELPMPHIEVLRPRGDAKSRPVLIYLVLAALGLLVLLVGLHVIGGGVGGH